MNNPNALPDLPNLHRNIMHSSHSRQDEGAQFEDALEEMIQEKINQTAEMLINERPEIAENNPEQIGAMAKAMVFDAFKLAIYHFS